MMSVDGEAKKEVNPTADEVDSSNVAEEEGDEREPVCWKRPFWLNLRFAIFVIIIPVADVLTDILFAVTLWTDYECYFLIKDLAAYRVVAIIPASVGVVILVLTALHFQWRFKLMRKKAKADGKSFWNVIVRTVRQVQHDKAQRCILCKGKATEDEDDLESSSERHICACCWGPRCMETISFLFEDVIEFFATFFFIIVVDASFIAKLSLILSAIALPKILGACCADCFTCCPGNRAKKARRCLSLCCWFLMVPTTLLFAVIGLVASPAIGWVEISSASIFVEVISANGTVLGRKRSNFSVPMIVPGQDGSENTRTYIAYDDGTERYNFAHYTTEEKENILPLVFFSFLYYYYY